MLDKMIDMVTERAAHLNIEYREVKGDIEGVCLKSLLDSEEVMSIPAPWRLPALDLEAGLYDIFTLTDCKVQNGEGIILCKALRFISKIKSGAVIVIDKKRELVMIDITEDLEVEVK